MDPLIIYLDGYIYNITGGCARIPLFWLLSPIRFIGVDIISNI